MPPARLDGPCGDAPRLRLARPGTSRLVEAGHPMPDAAGLAATHDTLSRSPTRRLHGRSRAGAALGRRLGQLDRAGAGLRFAEKQALTRALLEIRRGDRRDQHRAQASLPHQGRPAGARARSPARLVTLAISDVPGDDPAVIGSGPTVADPRRLRMRAPFLARYRIELPDAVTHALADPAQRNRRSRAQRCSQDASIRSGRCGRRRHSTRSNQQCVSGGYDPVIQLGTAIEGEARSVAAEHAPTCEELRAGAAP